MTTVAPVRAYRGKRVLDLAIVAVAALPALVVGALCALAVRLTSRGPVLFRQERIGLGGRPFTILKFRTMKAGDNPVIPDASVITPVGRWLRRLSLDELPQLLNVVRGDMSIVGPRPTLAYQVERYDERQRRRLAVRPGVTGWAQVQGRQSTMWADRIELDIDYVERQSLALDLRIVLRTALKLFTAGGDSDHPADDPLAKQ